MEIQNLLQGRSIGHSFSSLLVSNVEIKVSCGKWFHGTHTEQFLLAILRRERLIGIYCFSGGKCVVIVSGGCIGSYSALGQDEQKWGMVTLWLRTLHLFRHTSE